MAKTKCLRYLVTRQEIAAHEDRITFLLVGSVATGLCREDSDIDIALLCDQDVYKAISKETQWATGRPTEATVEHTQLHYYGITFGEVTARLQDLDDIYLYVYSDAVVLQDKQDNYTHRLSKLLSTGSDVRRQRIEGKLDMLMRRRRALRFCLQEGDPITVAKISLENIVLCLKVIALLDDVSFDPRKRFFRTALSGPLGIRHAKDVRQLFHELGALDALGNENNGRAFGLPAKLDTITDMLCDVARNHGFRVGLEKPDRRHTEY
jgi:predicted nucleotidyltransferase